MPVTHKPAKGTKAGTPAAAGTGRIDAAPKKAHATSPRRGEHRASGARQMQQADEMLGRIERTGEALSASADRLLRRVS
jgi:hypothetical protein